MATVTRQTADMIQETYRAHTVTSAKLFEAAKKVMPGGNTRSALYYPPYPTFLKEGQACRVTDVDGNDFLNNYTSLVHGHAHPKIVQGLQQQVGRGTAFASPTEAQTKLAHMLAARLPSIESLRFCNSGTEATLMALRAAKAFTGRNKILKLEGGYHGTHDAAVADCSEDPGAAEPNLGLFRGVVGDVLSTPANDIHSAAELIDLHGHDLAAVIVEPVMGAAGMLPLDAEFLRYLSTAAPPVEHCSSLMK
jgi:glutamate-1-semialdehyde 2,1-aminomutase